MWSSDEMFLKEMHAQCNKQKQKNKKTAGQTLKCTKATRNFLPVVLLFCSIVKCLK